MEIIEPAIEKRAPAGGTRNIPSHASPADQPNPRTRRTRPIPGLTRKLAELAAQTVQAALKEEERNAADHARVQALCNLVFSGGAFGTMLRNSTLLTAEDRAFLKELNYI